MCAGMQCLLRSAHRDTLVDPAASSDVLDRRAIGRDAMITVDAAGGASVWRFLQTDDPGTKQREELDGVTMAVVTAYLASRAQSPDPFRAGPMPTACQTLSASSVAATS